MIKILICSLLLSSAAIAEEVPKLSDELQKMSVPDNMAPAGVEREKVYAVQNRYSPLNWRPEFTLGSSYNFTGNPMLDTLNLEAGLGLHINGRFSVNAFYNYVGNQFTEDANRLAREQGRFPNTPFAKSMMFGTVAYNSMYGKFRITMDQVFYFDQYIALGGGVVDLNTGQQTLFVGDIGFAFWLGKWGSIRLGVRDFLYNEVKNTGESEMVHNIHGHMSVGYLF